MPRLIGQHWEGDVLERWWGDETDNTVTIERIQDTSHHVRKVADINSEGAPSVDGLGHAVIELPETVAIDYCAKRGIPYDKFIYSNEYDAEFKRLVADHQRLAYGLLWGPVKALLEPAVRGGKNYWPDVIASLMQGTAQLWLTVTDILAHAKPDLADIDYDDDDIADYVNQAIDAAAASGKRLDWPAGTYWTNTYPHDVPGNDCIQAASNLHMVFEPGVVLNAIPNALLAYRIIDVRGVENVIIEGGALLRGDRSDHEAGTGEHGMGVAIYNSERITVRGLRIEDCWGDGIYVGGTEVDGTSADVVIEDVICHDNRRNGLSIVAVQGCVVRGGRFSGSNGVAGAECGIDVEPNPGKAPVDNVVLEGVTCTGNYGPGISISQSISANVKVFGATCHDNLGEGISLGYPGKDIQLVSPNCQGNGLNGIFVFGDAAYTTRSIHIVNAICKENTLSGIKIGLNVDGFSVTGGTVALNGQHGVILDGTGGSVCDNGFIQGVHAHSNSQTTDVAFDNIHIGALAHNTRVIGCNVKKGSESNKPRNGIRITSNETAIIANNDLESGGQTANASGITNSNVRWRQNLGYLSEARGASAAISTGGTIAHGLATTPTSFSATPKTSGATDVWMTADATNLTVNFGGGGSHSFAWRAEV